MSKETLKEENFMKVLSGIISEKNESLSKCKEALECGGKGMDTIILLWNAAQVMRELGKLCDKEEVANQYAAGLEYKGKMEFEALKEFESI